MLSITQDFNERPGLDPAKWYEAMVIENDDQKHPDGRMLGRIQARIETLFDGIKNEDLPWAIPIWDHADGSSNISGTFHVPKKTTKVFLKFQAGKAQFPVYCGFHVDELTQMEEIKLNYPDRAVVRFQNKAMMVLDTKDNVCYLRHPGNLKIYIDGNVELEIMGNVDERVHGNVRRTIDGNLDEHVKGHVQRTVDSSVDEHFKATVRRKVDGAYDEHVGGYVSRYVAGNLKVGVAGTSHRYSAGVSTVESSADLHLEGANIHENSGKALGNPGDTQAVTDGEDAQFTEWPGIPGQAPGEGFSKLATPADQVVTDNEGKDTLSSEDKADMKAKGIDVEAAERNSPTAAAKDTAPAAEKQPVPKDCTDADAATTFPPSYKLSNNFTLGDLSTGAVLQRSAVVAQVGLTVPNIVCNLKELARNALDPITARYGRPTVNSGFRPIAGAKASSWHAKGCAADLQWAGISDQDYYDRAVWIKSNVPFCELILEYGGNRPWIHIAYSSGGNSTSNFKTRTSVANVYKPGILLLRNQPGIGGV